MGQMLVTMFLLYLFIAPGAVAHAAGAGDQDFAKGENLLKNKQYAEARKELEAGIQKDPSNIRGHFNLAEACRGLKSWACAEEHYEDAIELDAKAIATGSTEPRIPVPRHKAWQLFDEVKVWRLLEEARGLLTIGQAQPDKMKQAKAALDSANELGLNDEQQPVHQYLQAKVPGLRTDGPKPGGLTRGAPPTDLREASAVTDGPKPDGLTRGAPPTDPREVPMVLVPAGKFTRGSKQGDDEKPVRNIYLNAFYMDIFEVTVGQYAKYLEATDMESPPDWIIMNQPQHQSRPVVNVSWEDAVNYCKWAGKRLPREAEWEKAARGTDGRIYPWGNEAPTRLHANYGRKDWDNHLALTPVGSFEAGKSPYGIYDMAGNAWEWVFDWYGHDFYKNSPEKNPIGPAKGDTKVVRGGSWLYVPEFLRTSFRFNADPSDRQFGHGFRCAKTP